MMRTIVACICFGVVLVSPAVGEPRIDFNAYKQAHLDWRQLENSGDSEGGQDLLAEALDQILEPDGSLEGWALARRKDIVFDSLNLRGRMASSGRLAMALREQDRAERMVNAWAREAGAPEGFHCLLHAPLPQMEDMLSTLIWRMRTARASVLDPQGESLAGLELLERTVAEAGTANFKGWMMADELRRTYNELGNTLAFLGHWDRAVEVFDRAIAEPRNVNHYRSRRTVALARMNRLFPMAKMKDYTPEIVAEAKEIMNLPGAGLRDVDRAAMERQIAKFEYRAGQVDEARGRVEALLGQKGELSRVDRMYLERIYYIEDAERTDENATDADYEEMLDHYRERGILRSLPTVYRSYAFFLDRAERTAEAIPMLEKAIELTEGNGWRLHLPPLLANLGEMHDRMGSHEAAAECWVKIDALSKELEEDALGWPESRRVRVALLRIDWLERNGKTEEAVAQLAALRQSAKRDEIGKLQAETLDSIKIAAAKAKEEPPEVVAVLEPLVVIEPLATQSLIEPDGVPARTRFSLLNPGGRAVEGELRASGRAVKLAKVSRGRGARLELGEGEGRAFLGISLAAGERFIIDASAPASAAECELSWFSGGEVVSIARWVVTTEKPKERLGGAVRGTTASVARSHKFYAAPLFQELRWGKELERKAKNFRVRVAGEAWVRYQLPDGQTIAVDVNGDGDFEDAGDSIASGFDSDGNLFPDALAGDGLGVLGIEVFVFPSSDSEESTSVDFEVLEGDGDWKLSARNELRKAVSK